MAKAALAYAARGWPVFPCSPDNKQPLTRQGFKDASSDPKAIDHLWMRAPSAMVGVPTGPAIGAFVIDLDPKPPQTAGGLLLQLREALGVPLPPCPMVRTPRGGLHLYFAYPEGQAIGNRAGVLPGIDVRGDGGYVITPPSVRAGREARAEGVEGRAYAWEVDAGLDEFAPPPAPPELLRFVTERRQEAVDRPASGAAPPPAGDGRELKYALAALEDERRKVAQAPRGQRNTALNNAALKLGQLVAGGALAEATVIAALEQAAAASGLAKDDGLRSVRATLRSGLRAGLAQPRRPPAGRPATPKKRKASGSQAAKGEAGMPGEGGGPGRGGGDDEADPETLRRCAGYEQNDTGNAQRLQAHFGAEMLNVREVGPHCWSGAHWESAGGDEGFRRYAQQTAKRIAAEAFYLEPNGREREAIEAAADLRSRDYGELAASEKKLVDKALEAEDLLSKRRGNRRKFAISSGNSNRIQGMLKEALPHMTVPPETLDADPLAINCTNGTLRLYKETVKEEDPDWADESGPRYIERARWRVRLDPHRREDRIAKRMPVQYDPAAACPRWLAFMERFQPKEPIRHFLQMFHGYALTGLMGEQSFCYNYGLGANGKTTFMECLARLMGSYAQVLPAEALTGDLQRRGDQATPEFARLPGARLVRCAELPRGQGFRENTLKLLTGGEPLLVRHLHCRFFEMRPSFKAIGSGNDKPSIGGVDEGIWRRIKLVPWEVAIPLSERRPMERVLRDFMAEGSGILNWLLAGLVDYLENGLVVPPEVRVATESYRSDMDPVGEFCGACLATAAGQQVTARELYNAYVAWCHANSVKPFAERTFAGIMVQKGYQKEHGRIRLYRDVRLKDVPADPDRLDGGGFGH